MKLSLYFSLLPAAALFAAPSLRAQTLVNPSFEINGGNGSTAAAGSGWTFTGNVDYHNDEGSTAGVYSAVFNDMQNANTGIIYETLSGTTSGTIYQVNFDFGSFQAVGASGTQTLQAEVRDGTNFNSGNELILAGSGAITPTSGGTIGSNTSLLQVSDSTGSTTMEFNGVNFLFTAQSANSTFVFRDVGNFTQNSDLVLDNIRVAAVPEPATWAMMVGGLSLLLVGQRFRRAARVV